MIYKDKKRYYLTNYDKAFRCKNKSILFNKIKKGIPYEINKPTNKNRKLFDEQELYLYITKSGKYWYYKYNYANREKLLSLGVYSGVSLKTS